MFKNKLTELLKTVPEIKSDLEELRFGCKFINKYKLDEIDIIISEIRWWNFHSIIWWNQTHFPHISQIDKVIWNPLEERHLRMYCESIFRLLIVSENLIYLRYMDGDGYRTYAVCELDNTKSFDNQSEEVYEKIFNYLN